MRHHPSGGMDSNPTNVGASRFDLAGVETGPNWQTDLFCRRAESDRAFDSSGGTIEGRKNAVASRLD